jgi:AraC-like DNA-binding protein
MPAQPVKITEPPVDGRSPNPVSFRTEDFCAGMVFPARRQPWAELNFALTGIAEFTIEGERYLSPPHYAIWIPAGVDHHAWVPNDIRYVSVYIHNDRCDGLPAKPCTLGINALIKAILADFADRGLQCPESPADLRMVAVLLDQLRLAPRRESYLPTSDDPLLAPVLNALRDDPGDRRSLAEWARGLDVAERTLSRRFLQTLGVSFNDWRQRIKLVTAMALLDKGVPVHAIAERLGYGNASAFIAMFRQLTGLSPTDLRKTHAAREADG